jgi:hypothetical protein
MGMLYERKIARDGLLIVDKVHDDASASKEDIFSTKYGRGEHQGRSKTS